MCSICPNCNVSLRVHSALQGQLPCKNATGWCNVHPMGDLQSEKYFSYLVAFYFAAPEHRMVAKKAIGCKKMNFGHFQNPSEPKQCLYCKEIFYQYCKTFCKHYSFINHFYFPLLSIIYILISYLINIHVYNIYY